MSGFAGDPRYRSARRDPQAFRGALAEMMGLAPRAAGWMLETMVPGSSDYAAARDSVGYGLEMASALRGGQWGRAAKAGGLSTLAALGALPMIPSLAGITRQVYDLPFPAWHRMEGFMQAIRNPTRRDLGKITKQHGALRAVHDVDSGDRYVWPAEDMLHEEAIRQLRLSDRSENLGTIWGADDYDRLYGR